MISFHSPLQQITWLAAAQVLGLGLLSVPTAAAAAHAKPHQHDLPTLEDLRVRNLEKTVPAYALFEGQMFAGSLPMDNSNSDGTNQRTGFLQFWLFVPDKPTAPDTMVSWFNGGPGCSSFATGIMFENGPGMSVSKRSLLAICIRFCSNILAYCFAVTVPLHPAGWCCEAEDEPLQYNPYGWTNATVMLYVEQPIGVGFSEATNGTPPPASEDDVAADFDAFLQNFYKVFNGQNVDSNTFDPTLDLTMHKLYLVGESYAGIYIPSIARGIYLRNQQAADGTSADDRFLTPLAGVAIGNGKLDAMAQDPAVIDFSYWHGLIDGPTRDYLQDQWASCVKNVNLAEGEIGFSSDVGIANATNGKSENKPFHPFSVRDDCGILNAILDAAGAGTFDKVPSGPNLYEYSTWDPYAAGEGDKGTVGTFYNDMNVQKSLNVPLHRQGLHWEGCIPELAQFDDRRRLATKTTTNWSSNHQRRRLFMDNDKPWSVIPYVAQLLDDAKIVVLIYSGDRDIICCTQGSEEALRKMDWSGTRDPAPGHKTVDDNHNAWSQATRSLWVFNNTYPAGYIKSYKNLHLLTVYNAGHMLPYNQPGPALDMMNRFLRGESFHDEPLMDFTSRPVPDSEAVVVPRVPPTANQNDIHDHKEKMHSTSSPSASISPTTMVVITGIVAFLAGYGVARLTTDTRRQHETAGFEAGYGSISMQVENDS